MSLRQPVMKLFVRLSLGPMNLGFERGDSVIEHISIEGFNHFDGKMPIRPTGKVLLDLLTDPGK